MTFGEKLFNLRKSKGFSQEELALQLNISRQAISRWEMGTALPDSSNLLQISKLFNVTTDYLLYDEYENEKDIPIIKETEDIIKKEHNRQIVMILLLGLNTIYFIWQIIGLFVYKSVLMILIPLTFQIANFIGFEIGFHKYKTLKDASKYRKKYYRISIWLFLYFPIRMILVSLWSFYPRPYTFYVFEFSIILVYLIVSTIFTVIKWGGSKVID